VQCLLYNVRCTVYSVHFVMSNLQCLVCHVECTMYDLLGTMCNLLFVVQNVQCGMDNVQSAVEMCLVQSAKCYMQYGMYHV